MHFMNKQIFFISGGSGAGKSTVMDLVKTALPHSDYHIHDMDEVGVPDNVDQQWRIEQTENWVKEGVSNSENKIQTIIFGITRPEELHEALVKLKVDSDAVGVFLLDANPEVLRSRLEKRYQVRRGAESEVMVTGKPVEQFIDDSINFARILREEAQSSGYEVIDTSDLEPKAVAERVVDTIHKLSETH